MEIEATVLEEGEVSMTAPTEQQVSGGALVVPHRPQGMEIEKREVDTIEGTVVMALEDPDLVLLMKMTAGEGMLPHKKERGSMTAVTVAVSGEVTEGVIEGATGTEAPLRRTHSVETRWDKELTWSQIGSMAPLEGVMGVEREGLGTTEGAVLIGEEEMALTEVVVMGSIEGVVEDLIGGLIEVIVVVLIVVIGEASTGEVEKGLIAVALGTGLIAVVLGTGLIEDSTEEVLEDMMAPVVQNLHENAPSST